MLIDCEIGRAMEKEDTAQREVIQELREIRVLVNHL